MYCSLDYVNMLHFEEKLNCHIFTIVATCEEIT
jgi:hypothetical protein